MKRTLFASIFILFAAAMICTADEAKTLKAGDTAPAVTGKDQHDKLWKLNDFAGKKNVLLYFYPKDNTPGCTKEACGLRDQIETLKKDDVEVVGVSFDNGESHQKFISDHQLNFTLLQDTDGKIADAFGARMPGKNMARRVSFLIGKDGKIKHVTDTPKAETHLQEMKEAVGKLSAK